MNVGTEVEICIGHRLMDYLGKCANPHGHNYRICVQATGNMKKRDYGILLDFSDLKDALNKVLAPFDHAMMLRDDDPLVPFLVAEGSKVVKMEHNPTAENFAEFIKTQLTMLLPMEWKVRVYETTKSYAEV
jgi:6-pyruvoyltetrahydropterin/6-carboxytetrahydropterin synthase